MDKKIITAAAFLFLIIIIIVVFSYFDILSNINRPLNAGNTQVTSFEIKQGQGVEQIADGLQKAKLITGSDYFKLYLWEKGLGSKLRAGAYELSPSMTIAEIVSLLTHGENGLKFNETRVVITEGSTDDEILAKLREAGAISTDDNFDNVSINPQNFSFLEDSPVSSNFEGYLFPDTYNFFKGSSMQDVTTKLLENFDAKLTPQMRDDIKAQNKTIYDVLIMASIVEKESPSKSDMPTIAGIFYNRLSVGMALQSDATINYITKAGRPMPTGDDLAIDSPYNTYKYKGLPPTPICNPGIEAIKAAIYPEKTDYFYFLMPQNGSGQTIYSKTYEEHLQNKAKYLK